MALGREDRVRRARRPLGTDGAVPARPERRRPDGAVGPHPVLDPGEAAFLRRVLHSRKRLEAAERENLQAIRARLHREGRQGALVAEIERRLASDRAEATGEAGARPSQ